MLFQLPPRITRLRPDGYPPKSSDHLASKGVGIRPPDERQQCLDWSLQVSFTPVTPFIRGLAGAKLSLLMGDPTAC